MKSGAIEIYLAIFVLFVALMSPKLAVVVAVLALIYLSISERRKDQPVADAPTTGLSEHTENLIREKENRKQKIMEMFNSKTEVTNNEVETALGVSDASATNYLDELEQEGKIEQIGKTGHAVSYRKKA